ncbi:sugar phosphate isomerase/epimerase [Brachybacterium sp. YJGR34]|uniref:sugar phosphate isomerase/epimerase family protein n=1 Tax=Brachybacterium sp. YJGR34 TaxID=2059911 RepID=UPI000E0C2310|nr:sugar phosphate isomerase/epimerase [Brachybacterium sp. YJGR34]
MAVKGLALYAIRDALAHDPDRALARVAEIGFEGVEPFGLGNPSLTRGERLTQAKMLRRSIDLAGLTASSAHTRFPAPSEMDWLLEELAIVGVPVAIASIPEHVLGFGRDVLTTPGGVQRFADAFGLLADRAAEHEVRIGYHNHWWDWPELPDGTRGYDRFLQALDPSIVAEVDLYWAHTAGRDVPALLRGLGDRVELVHFKDGPGRADDPLADQVPLGYGSADLDGAVAALPAGLEWALVELDRTALDPFDVVTAGYRWLTAHGF